MRCFEVDDDNIHLRINRLKRVIQAVYHTNCKSGLTKWIKEYENAFSEMAIFEKRAWADHDTISEV